VWRALRDIEPGEELCFDYNQAFEEEEPWFAEL
jgi:SET domain-containing protein